MILQVERPIFLKVHLDSFWYDYFSAPGDFRVNPGAVECIVQHPTIQDQVGTFSIVGISLLLLCMRV
jgi:hypothetical protein